MAKAKRIRKYLTEAGAHRRAKALSIQFPAGMFHILPHPHDPFRYAIASLHEDGKGGTFYAYCL
ncbi:hypothetical protein [Reyranella sp.]|uniref:hypothetical protein n=1 Tax=Reyranella sp. TaxID=1929291 RepID=UPI003D0B9AF4